MWPVPKDRRFLGLSAYYQQFVKEFAQITKPLNQLMEFQTTFHQTNECQQGFEDLNKELCSLSTLEFPDSKKQFIKHRRRKKAIGSVLSQVDNG